MMQGKCRKNKDINTWTPARYSSPLKEHRPPTARMAIISKPQPEDVFETGFKASYEANPTEVSG